MKSARGPAPSALPQAIALVALCLIVGSRLSALVLHQPQQARAALVSQTLDSSALAARGAAKVSLQGCRSARQLRPSRRIAPGPAGQAPSPPPPGNCWRNHHNRPPAGLRGR